MHLGLSGVARILRPEKSVCSIWLFGLSGAWPCSFILVSQGLNRRPNQPSLATGFVPRPVRFTAKQGQTTQAIGSADGTQRHQHPK